MWLARVSVFWIVAMQLGMAGCAMFPVADRPRIVDVPLAGVQSDLEFSITSAARADMSCADNAACSSEPLAGARPFAREVERLAARLEKSAVKQYPDLAWCSPRLSGGCFDVYVVAGDEPGSSSSANGRIALQAALGRWLAYDGVLAFVIAREMGHVIARHHEENSSASIATSVLLNVLVPVSGLFRSLISLGGARLAAKSNRDVQAAEADAIAFNLLAAAGFRSGDVARNLHRATASLDGSAWATGFRSSASRYAATVRSAEAPVVSVRAIKSADRRELAADRKCASKAAELEC